SPGLSKQLSPLLDPSVPQIRIDPYGMWHDAARSASRFIRADPPALLEQLAKRVSQKSRNEWLGRWLSAERKARTAIDSVLDAWEHPSEPATARDLAACLPGGSNLVVASSMPVRDLDWFMAPRQDIRVMANRGANGIDGFVSTILGAALSSDRFTCGLLGDLALLHDQNGLLQASMQDVNACLVVINNDGGGIFSFLPQAEDAHHFERLFGTPHGRNFEKLAAFYGCAYRRIARAADLQSAVAEAHGAGGVTLVEVPTDRASNVRAHRDIWDAVKGSLEARLFS
ncbi:MAG: thiamine pyrophosphate-dependent enzyme, partial [Actinomycetota bacterium]